MLLVSPKITSPLHIKSYYNVTVDGEILVTNMCND